MCDYYIYKDNDPIPVIFMAESDDEAADLFSEIAAAQSEPMHLIVGTRELAYAEGGEVHYMMSDEEEE